MEDKDYKIINGNMLEELDKLEENSIDNIITDPPYELGFMGKSWDSTGIAFSKTTWEKCLRVLKPGGYLLAFGGSRTFYRIGVAIEDAGFEIRDTIMWMYGSGFPKSLDISKQIDRRGAVSISWFGEYLKSVLEEKGMTQAELSKHFPSKTGNITGRVSNWINGLELPTNEQFNKVCEILNLPIQPLQEVEREVIGKGKAGLTKGKIANFVGDTEFDITAPATNLAKEWEGWGTQLKPSFEPIIVARKPISGSLVDNIIENRIGGLNIKECRVPAKQGEYDIRHYTDEDCFQNLKPKESKFQVKPQPDGRFPANTILTYDETDKDEVCGGFPLTGQGGNTGGYSYNGTTYSNSNILDNIGDKPTGISNYDDIGSAARYFYCAKASARDRDEGLEDFITKTKVFNGKSNKSSTDIKDVEQRFTTEAKNIHPTVKPTELMQYLVRLVSPKGATILDPFMGSGSTGKAVMYENVDRNTNYKFIGIEREKEYCEIAEARIVYAKGDRVVRSINKETGEVEQKVERKIKQSKLF